MGKGLAEYQNTVKISKLCVMFQGRSYCSIQWTLTAFFGLSSMLGAGDSGPRFEAFHGEMAVADRDPFFFSNLKILFIYS